MEFYKVSCQDSDEDLDGIQVQDYKEFLADEDPTELYSVVESQD